MNSAPRRWIKTAFLLLIIVLNLAGFIVREYLIIKSPEEETRWIEYLFAGTHLTIALCAFLIWRGQQTAIYLFLAITLFVIVLDLGLTLFNPAHKPSIPDLILAFSESVCLLILFKPQKNDPNL